MRQGFAVIVTTLLAVGGASAQTRTDVHPGRVQIRGFGLALDISAAGSTNHNVIVRNTQAGTTASTEISIGNDQSATTGRLFSASSTYTPSAPFDADSFSVIATRPGGMAIGALGSGSVRVWSGGAQRALIDSSGRWAIGGTTLAAETLIRLTGAYTGVAGAATGVYVDPTLTGGVNLSIVGFWSAPTLVEAASGTHQNLIGAYLAPPTITAGAASVVNAMSVYIPGAPSASGAANWALYIASGASAFGDGGPSAPGITFGSDPDTGIYRVSSNLFGLSAAGNAVIEANFSVIPYAYVGASGAYGSGAVMGPHLIITRNTSGNGAPGVLQLAARNGGLSSLWTDTTGVIRVGTSPTEASGDTGGTVVGAQTSTWESKDIFGRENDTAGALAELLQTPVYRFSYKSGAYNGQQFVGITTRTSPLFGMDQGRSFNPVTSFGVTVLAIQELERRVRALEAAR